MPLVACPNERDVIWKCLSSSLLTRSTRDSQSGDLSYARYRRRFPHQACLIQLRRAERKLFWCESRSADTTSTMAIDHIMIKVKSWKKALTFYSVALKPIGYELLLDNDKWGGFHVPGSFEGRIYVKQGEFKVSYRWLSSDHALYRAVYCRIISILDSKGWFRAIVIPHRLYQATLHAEEHPGRIHFAVAAPSSDAVKAFYSAALANGGTDNGAPGYRAHYR